MPNGHSRIAGCAPGRCGRIASDIASGPDDLRPGCLPPISPQHNHHRRQGNEEENVDTTRGPAAVFPGAKVVLHLSNGYDNSLFRWFFDGMKANGAKYDVIGMSHYPTSSNWSSLNAQLSTNMADMVSRYKKPVIIAETGMDWQQAAASKAMLADLLNRVAGLGSNGLGVLYWEPQAYPGWQGYTWGAMDGSGRFTSALDPF
ncbi:hypothetical protein CDN98_02985 [Roseateles terrae]|nr:hypothetical protein CDN98_02985 [Roseateles terrae]